MSSSNDKTDSLPVTASSNDVDEEARNYISREGGWNRVVKYLIKKNEVTLEYYPERSLIHEAVGTGAIVSFLVASYFSSRNSYNIFIQVNRASTYSTKFVAERAAMDASVFGGLKHGLLWGTRTSLFIGSFLSVSQALTVYRNKTSPLNFAIGGACTGALARFHIGPRHLVAGSIIGGIMGLVVGVIVYPIAKITGETQEETHIRRVCDMLREKRNVQAPLTRGPIE